MMKRIFLLLAFITGIYTSFAQGPAYVSVGGTRPIDTTYVARSLKVDSMLRLIGIRYHSSSTDSVLVVATDGKVYKVAKASLSTTYTGTLPVLVSGAAISLDTGRSAGQVATGGSLKKVKDSLGAVIASFSIAGLSSNGSSIITVSYPNFVFTAGAAVKVGTTDAYDYNIYTNNVNRINISNGTGIVSLSAYTTNGGMFYANGAGTMAQTGAGTSTTVLHGGTAPAYGTVALGTDVSGTLPLANITAGLNGQILINNATPSAAWVTVSGDATISNAGVVTLGTVAATKGGTGLTAYGSANTLLGMNNAATALEYKTITTSTTAVSNDFGITLTGANSIVFNWPDASATVRGLITTGTQTFAGAKTLTGALAGTSAAFSSSLSATTGTFSSTVTAVKSGGMIGLGTGGNGWNSYIAIMNQAGSTKYMNIGCGWNSSVDLGFAGNTGNVNADMFMYLSNYNLSGYLAINCNGAQDARSYQQIRVDGNGVSIGTSATATAALDVSGGYVKSAGYKNNAAATTVNGSTSGTAVFTMPEQGTAVKEVVIDCVALVGTATYTFPNAMTYSPDIVTTDGLAAAIVTTRSTTAVTVTGATTTGRLYLKSK